MSHTPGPWLSEKGDRKQERNISAPNGDPRLRYSSWRGLAVVFGSDEDRDVGKLVMKANARLIAAAPDLLEALEAALEQPTSDGGGWDPMAWEAMARAAVRKARGAP